MLSFSNVSRKVENRRHRPQFGRYECLFRIASGGMANVYVARRRGEAGFQKFVAIKCLHPFLATDSKFVTMFLDEARLTACVSSPHVVATLDTGRTEEGLPFLVMELVVGSTLQYLTQHSPEKCLPIAIATEWIAQTAEGLHDAHEARTPFGVPLEVVHRDVSPQNILVGVDGYARLSDFGVATADGRLTQTHAGEVKGKWAYFAPERVANQELDRRSDIFSLGIVAWEALTGKRLFYSKDPMEILSNISSAEIPMVTALRPNVPQALDRCVARALRRNRSERYESAADFATALRRSTADSVGLPSRRELMAFVRSCAEEELLAFQHNVQNWGADRPEVAVSLRPVDEHAAHLASDSITVPARPLRSPHQEPLASCHPDVVPEAVAPPQDVLLEGRQSLGHILQKLREQATRTLPPPSPSESGEHELV